jgi:hypothetical protein
MHTTSERSSGTKHQHTNGAVSHEEEPNPRQLKGATRDETERLRRNAQKIEAALTAITRIEEKICGLKAAQKLPELIEEILREEMWRERLLESRAEPVKFDHIEDFIEAESPLGWGVEVGFVFQLVDRHMPAYCLLDEALQRPPGRPARNLDGVKRFAAPTGNSKRSHLRWLRANTPDLYTKVFKGEFTISDAWNQAQSSRGNGPAQEEDSGGASGEKTRPDGDDGDRAVRESPKKHSRKSPSGKEKKLVDERSAPNGSAAPKEEKNDAHDEHDADEDGENDQSHESSAEGDGRAWRVILTPGALAEADLDDLIGEVESRLGEASGEQLSRLMGAVFASGNDHLETALRHWCREGDSEARDVVASIVGDAV